MNMEYTESIWELDPDQAIRDLLQLEEGEHCSYPDCFYPESDSGHDLIIKSGNQYQCGSYSMYGGEQSLEETKDNAEDAFNCLSSWT